MEVEYSLFPLSGSVCCRHEACEARCRSGRRRHMLVCYCQCRETGRSCGRTGAGRLSAGAVTDLRMKAASSLLSSCIPPTLPYLFSLCNPGWASQRAGSPWQTLVDPGKQDLRQSIMCLPPPILELLLMYSIVLWTPTKVSGMDKCLKG